MNRKRILLLLGTLVVLLLAAWLSGYFSGSVSTVETPELAFGQSEFQAITIRKGGETIAAVQTDDGTWRLQEPVDAKVDTATSSALFSGLGNIEVESLVSSRADRHTKFLVDSVQATYVRLDGEEPVEIYVGKTGPDFQSRYIRLGGDDRVFLATGVPEADPSLDRWRDKLLWSYPKETIMSVAVTTPESEYQLVLGDTQWVLEQNGTSFKPDSAKVERYMDRLAIVKADGFLMDMEVGSVVDSASFSIEIQRSTGDSQLKIMRRESDAAAVVDESQDVVKLFSHRATNLAPEPSKLLPE